MFKAPTRLPQLETMLDNLCATEKQVSKHLDISVSTLKRWQKAGQAPRSAMLAIFFETSWGRSAVASEADAWAKINYMRCLTLERRVKELEKELKRLQSLLEKQETGAANAPVFLINV